MLMFKYLNIDLNYNIGYESINILSQTFFIISKNNTNIKKNS